MALDKGLRETDEEAVRLARTLIRGARFGALAVIEADDGAPLASRVGVASDADGAPLILVSMLSAHTPALLADPRCSLLLGEPGPGDALAHPRISLACRAAALDRGSLDHARAERRYLARNPKAKLYASLGDFFLFRLEPGHASLVGGFGRAYRLQRADLVLAGAILAELDELESSAIEHMNADHADAVALYGHRLAGGPEGPWRIVGMDAEGVDLALADEVARVWFPRPIASASHLRGALADLAAQARRAE